MQPEAPEAKERAVAEDEVGAPEPVSDGRTWIVLNSWAGNAADGLDVVQALAADPGVTVRRTRRPIHATELAREAVEAGVGLVVAAGGDGTIHEVVNGLMQAGGRVPNLGILPLGTGNDLARALALPEDPEEAAAVIREGSVREIDVLAARYDGGPPRWIVNFALGGFAGRIDRHLTPARRRRWGRWMYLRAVFSELLRARKYRATVVVDGERLPVREIRAILVANGGWLGGGIPGAPGADLRDGRAEVVVVPGLAGYRLPRVLGSALRGRHLGIAEVLHRRAERIEIRGGPDLHFVADGQPLCRQHVILEMNARRLPVVVPGS